MKLTYLILLILVINLSGCSSPRNYIKSEDPVIVAFGDSLTSGVGASEGQDYPSILSKRLGINIINSGASGDTTGDALDRIDEDVIKYKPDLVIVQFGANDFFQNIPRSVTERNLEVIIEKLKEKNALVLLIGTRLALFGDEYRGIFKRVSKKTKCLYMPDILKGIIQDSSLKSDEVHPNAKGYEIVAGRIFEKIRPLLNSQKKSTPH